MRKNLFFVVYIALISFLVSCAPVPPKPEQPTRDETVKTVVATHHNLNRDSVVERPILIKDLRSALRTAKSQFVTKTICLGRNGGTGISVNFSGNGKHYLIQDNCSNGGIWIWVSPLPVEPHIALSVDSDAVQLADVDADGFVDWGSGRGVSFFNRDVFAGIDHGKGSIIKGARFETFFQKRYEEESLSIIELLKEFSKS